MSSCWSAPQRRYSSSVIVQRRAHYLFPSFPLSNWAFQLGDKGLLCHRERSRFTTRAETDGSSRKVSELNTDSFSYAEFFWATVLLHAVISDTGQTNRTSCTFTAESTCLLHKPVDDVMVVLSIFYIQSEIKGLLIRTGLWCSVQPPFNIFYLKNWF